MDTLLYQYNPWWEENHDFRNIKPRHAYLRQIRHYLTNKQIVALTGLRRVGKTSLMKLIIDELIRAGTLAKHILYVSLDDYLLQKYTILDIIAEFRRLHKIPFSEQVFLFLDEITYKSDFHIQLKNVYDNQHAKIMIASSSTSMMTDKKASLTGRSIVLEVKPLMFDEYLSFMDIVIKKRDQALSKSYFLDYCQSGGMPENIMHPSREYMMALVDDIIQKDIAAFHGIRNVHVLRDYFTLLMERSGKQVSINKVANILSISADTSKRYLSLFESTYLIYLVPRFGKTNQILLSPKKVYAADLGIKYVFMGTRDLGSYFENYIYLLLRNHQDIYYLYENGIEIDFITKSNVLIESKFYSELNDKQQHLFDTYPAQQKIVIDAVEKLSLLDDLTAIRTDR